jgi:hypothetical protein
VVIAWPVKDGVVERNGDVKLSSGGKNECKLGESGTATAARADGGEDGYG